MNTAKSIRSFQRTFEQAFRSRHVAAPIRAFPITSARKHLPSNQIRLNSTDTYTPPPLTDRTETSQSDADSIAMRKALSPAYQLWFTCKKCLERSGHTVSKQAYHHGTTVINCPKCKSQHLISDHLKIFSDQSMTMEDIAREHGEKLKKGRLGADGDIEFYDEEAERKVLEGASKVGGELGREG